MRFSLHRSRKFFTHALYKQNKKKPNVCFGILQKCMPVAKKDKDFQSIPTNKWPFLFCQGFTCIFFFFLNHETSKRLQLHCDHQSTSHYDSLDNRNAFVERRRGWSPILLSTLWKATPCPVIRYVLQLASYMYTLAFLISITKMIGLYKFDPMCLK